MTRPAPSTSAGAPRPERTASIDLVRGLVMVIMLLDHMRDLVHESAFTFDPTDLSRTTTALFLTRWVTHFCAPVFVFLAGVSIWFQVRRAGDPRLVRAFLFKRGLWLVFLELTAVRLGSWFNLDLHELVGPLQVIWVIGISMVLLAPCIRLPRAVLAALAAGLIAGHNLLDGISVAGFAGPGSPATSPLAAAWILLHQGGPLWFGAGPIVFAFYPLVPWPGVMLAGFLAGGLWALPPERRRLLLVRTGLAAVAVFVLLRASNLYGDASRFVPRSDPGSSVLAFLNTTKYPPSLLFLLMTLGPALIALGLLEGRRLDGWLGRILVRLGRVPLFFYLLQWPLAHATGIVFTLVAGRSIAPYFAGLDDHLAGRAGKMGFGLPWVYLAFALGLLVLVPLCLWFARVKSQRRAWWLAYL